MGALFFIFILDKDTRYPAEKEDSTGVSDIARMTDAQRIRIVFTGDVMLSRTVGAKMEQKSDFGYPARKIAGFFKDADIVVVNFEGPMSDRGTNVGSKYSFRADPRAVETLKLLNVSVASLANNHMWDYGRDALMDTASILEANGILPVGAGKDYAAANALKVREVNGIKIGFLSYTDLYPANLSAGPDSPGVSSFDLERAVAETKARKDPLSSAVATGEKADILVVLFHWGEEYQPHPTQEQKNIAHSLIDAGADMVVGHHPHVAQDIEEYNGKWIFYSLGNFIFDQYFSTSTMQGLVVEAFIEEGRVKEVKVWESFLNREYEVERLTPKDLTF